ncbi:MAG: hypothetical protein JST39_17460, partial [Bacteroidetes bacterium]|nr:hypothetical protein [Bacteroidota bacterium]
MGISQRVIYIGDALRQKQRQVVRLAVLVSAILFLFSFYRSIELVKMDPFGDLRNRMVAARLIHEGHSPYWYKWKAADSTRYYDKWNIFPLRTTNMTASPFYLHLILPICEQPQSRLCWYWLVIEYILYALILLMGWRLSSTPPRKAGTLLLCSILPFTAAWTHHIMLSQSYLPISFLLVL